MKTYVWVTFAFMGWGYYEMSGGQDFVPETRQTAEAHSEVPASEAPEIVSRALTSTLISVSTSNVDTTPDAEVIEALAEAIALDAVDKAPEAAPEVAEAAAPQIDIREVAGSRVNMRVGPGTGFDVITTLNGGTKLEVLDVNADGWANVATVDRGVEGWMAARLLTEPET